MTKAISINIKIEGEKLDIVTMRKGFSGDLDETLTTLGVLEKIKAREIERLTSLKRERKKFGLSR